MPTLDTSRKMVSDYVGGFTDVHGVQFSCARLTVENATDAVFDPIGLPVIWNDSDAFIFYTNTTLISALTTDSNAPDGAAVGIVVGSRAGFGESVDDVTVGSGGIELTVMFRGPASVKTDQIDWAVTDVDGASSVTAALTAQKAAFLLQLEKQGIAGIVDATVVTPTFVS